MPKTLRPRALALALAAGLAVAAPTALRAQAAATAPTAAVAAADSKENYAYALGMMAAVYGYPMINNTTKRYFMTEKPMGIVSGTLNGFFHVPRPANADDKYSASVISDLYYSVGWIDVSKEPLVVTVPDAGERYYGIQLMEMYSDIFGYIGQRATGNKAGSFLIAGPGWKGKVPKGIAGVYRSPTPTALMLMRILFRENDAADIEKMKQLQRDTVTAPLSYWLAKKPYVNEDRNVIDPVLPKADPLWFFRTLNRGMTENPPPAKDQALVDMLKAVGIGPGLGDDFSRLDESTRRGLQRAQADGMKLLQDTLKTGDTKVVNQWGYGEKSWGRTAQSNDFMTRAVSQSMAGMQEHHIEEVVKLRTYNDGSGQPLDGANNRYVISFGPGQIPKAKSFWSVTLYDEKFALVANEINRYSRGSTNKDMKFGADGSLEIFLQADRPADDKLGNWLPAPKGPFNLFLRGYLPGEDLIKQTYAPPPVQRVQ